MNPLSIDRYMVFDDASSEIVNAANPSVASPGLALASRPGHSVSAYTELLEKLAALRYHNSRFRLLYRGQRHDYRVNVRGKAIERSSLYPSIFRATGASDRTAELSRRFDRLSRAERLLTEQLQDANIRRDQVVRWSIIQHYEVARTPLLDLTSSIQAALSFALDSDPSEAYFFVFAFPQLTGPVSISIESMTQVVDLTQVVPPEALRPHFQDGLLAGDYPIVRDAEDSHGGRGMVGNSFACRLISKFHLKDAREWQSQGFQPVSKDILFPDEKDPWFAKLAQIKTELNTET